MKVQVVRLIAAGIVLALAVGSAIAQPHVDLRMTMVPRPNPVICGQIVEFVGTVSNAGPDLAERVEFDTPGPYPYVFDLVSISTVPAVPCEPIVNRGVICSVGSLASNASVSFRVALRPNPQFYGRIGGYLEGSVQVRQLGVATFDPPENNIATFKLRVLPISAIPSLSPLAIALLAAALLVAAAVRLGTSVAG